MNAHIYVIKLVGGRFYVGRTTNFDKTIAHHRGAGIYGREWTRLYKPVAGNPLLEFSPMTDPGQEDATTLRYMRKYGYQNVRGGTFCQVDLPPDQISTIKSMLRSSNDQCHGCGQKGHYIQQCTSNRTTPRETTHAKDEMICFKCGREGHGSNDCYAKTDVTGFSINSRTGKWCCRCKSDDHYGVHCRF